MINLIEAYNNLSFFQYLILFPIVIIEGPIATVVAGFMIAQKLMHFYLVFPLVVIADLIGDVIYYGLGRYGRNFGLKILRINKEKLALIEYNFKKNSGKTILFSKIAHGIGTIFLYTAGVVRIPIKKFIFYNAVGSIPKSLILIIIGYFFGHSYVRIGKYFDFLGFITLTLGLVLLFTYLKFVKKIKQKEKEL